MRNHMYSRDGFTPSEISSPRSSGLAPLARARSLSGFTLLEIIIFTGIFTIVVVAFLGVLVSVTRVQVRQLAETEVNTQSQFLLQTIQYYVERSAAVDISADTAVSTLTLRMSSSSEDPTTIRLSGTTAEFRETSGGTWQPLTSDSVEVTNLSFVKRTNAPGKDTVSVNFTIRYATDNIQRRFTQSLVSAVARVSAATFDSSVNPSAAGSLDLGATSGDWRSVNNTLFFSGANVGVGIASPAAKFQVSGGDIYIDTAARGVIMRSANGTCWRTTTTNAGALSTAAVTCP